MIPTDYKSKLRPKKRYDPYDHRALYGSHHMLDADLDPTRHFTVVFRLKDPTTPEEQRLRTQVSYPHLYEAVTEIFHDGREWLAEYWFENGTHGLHRVRHDHPMHPFSAIDRDYPSVELPPLFKPRKKKPSKAVRLISDVLLYCQRLAHGIYLAVTLPDDARSPPPPPA